jgi:hypothetical protein
MRKTLVDSLSRYKLPVFRSAEAESSWNTSVALSLVILIPETTVTVSLPGVIVLVVNPCPVPLGMKR